jgi:RimJ/RimL family protein N-acetyltransferase
MVPLELSSSRIRLRLWRDSDSAPFAAMNADPGVMEHMPALLTRAESDAMAARIAQSFSERGLGLWALEIPGVAPFAGYVGLSVPSFDAPFTPCVEVGWRLVRARWGAGYATEGARLAIRDGFERLGLEEIVSLTIRANLRSWRVMERLGMRRSPADDFEHPRLPSGHPLAPHVLYRLRRSEWARSHWTTV